MMNECSSWITVHAIVERSGYDENFLGPRSVNIQLWIDCTRCNLEHEGLSSIRLRPQQPNANSGKDFFRRNVAQMLCDNAF